MRISFKAAVSSRFYISLCDLVWLRFEILHSHVMKSYCESASISKMVHMIQE